MCSYVVIAAALTSWLCYSGLKAVITLAGQGSAGPSISSPPPRFAAPDAISLPSSTPLRSIYPTPACLLSRSEPFHARRVHVSIVASVRLLCHLNQCISHASRQPVNVACLASAKLLPTPPQCIGVKPRGGLLSGDGQWYASRPPASVSASDASGLPGLPPLDRRVRRVRRACSSESVLTTADRPALTPPYALIADRIEALHTSRTILQNYIATPRVRATPKPGWEEG